MLAVCIHACVCAHMYAEACANEDQRSVSVSSFFTLVFESGSLTEPGSRLAGQQVLTSPRNPLVPTSSVLAL